MLGWLMWTGCTRIEVVSDYELRISPTLLADQRDDVLGLAPEVKLLVRRPNADPAVWYAGIAADGTALELSDRPPLEAGTSLGVIFEHPGDDPSNWHRDRTIAYGELTVDAALADTEQVLDLAVVTPRVDALSRIDRMDAAARRLGGAVAALPDGRIYVFGGGDPDANTQVDVPGYGLIQIVNSDTVLELLPGPDGWASPVTLDLVLPVATFESPGIGAPPLDETARTNLTATPILTDEGWRILLVGGRYTYTFTGYPTRRWLVWNPDTRAFEGEGDLVYSRSSHLAVPIGGSKVLVFGGLIGGGIGGLVSYEILSPQTGKSTLGAHADQLSTPAGGNYGAYATPVGDEVVVCSGATSDDLFRLTPSAMCTRFTGSDRLDELPPLPEPVMGGAIAALADGGLLVTGGTPDPIVDVGGESEATDHAFRYDPDEGEWAEVGRMRNARAGHRAVSLPDGRVMVLGGSTRYAVVYESTGDTVKCTELFDPSTNTFTETTCNDAAEGQEPEVGIAAGFGAALQGTSFDGSVTDGGGSIGVFRLIPELGI
ncbi:MAG: hypothetical protein ABMA64_38965 [Myxococcota bacterium]